jgi:hypothetical protein
MILLAELYVRINLALNHCVQISSLTVPLDGLRLLHQLPCYDYVLFM